MSQKRIRFMCTAFRDGFQSVFGARVLTDDFLPAVEAACDAGITWLEAGGGARFQSSYFYCNEDSFGVMDRLRSIAGPEAELQTLARGVNVVGLDSQPSDVIKMHAELFKKHGISSIRNFDALNDVNNLIYSGKCIHEAGLKHQVCVTIMELPPGCTGAHDVAFYESCLRAILDADIPFDSVCFKDATGTVVPSNAYNIVKSARKMLPEGMQIHYHTHDTAGVGVASYIAALEAGADAIDLSLAPVSGGTCQADVAVMWNALRGTKFDLGVDIGKVLEAEKILKECMKDYFMPPEATMVEPLIPWSPMPGGALTANTQMLRDNGIMGRFGEIIDAMGEVVRLGGFGTSVTPVSQFYFQQAFNNVMFGPWKRIAEGYGKMVLGYFGKTPVEPDPEIVRIASEQLKLEPTKDAPIDLNDKDPSKGLKAAAKMLHDADLEETDENLFIAATCKDKGIAFLRGEAKVMVRKNVASADKEEKVGKGGVFTVKVGQKSYRVQKTANGLTVDGKPFDVSVSEGGTGGVKVVASDDPEGAGLDVVAPMPGSVFKIVCKEGDHVEEGDELIILEAMKMEIPVKAAKAGEVISIEVGTGEVVKSDQVLLTIA